MTAPAPTTTDTADAELERLRAKWVASCAADEVRLAPPTPGVYTLVYTPHMLSCLPALPRRAHTRLPPKTRVQERGKNGRADHEGERTPGVVHPAAPICIYNSPPDTPHPAPVVPLHTRRCRHRWRQRELEPGKLECKRARVPGLQRRGLRHTDI
jgi:hypothetical protein